MPDDQATNVDQGQQSLGWRAALPDEFKEHEYVKTFTKPGDFVKAALEIKTERDSLKTKMDAAPRPVEKQEEFEFNEKDGYKPDPQMVDWARKTFMSAKLTRDQGKAISESWNEFILSLQKQQTDAATKQRTDAEAKLKSEWGDKYDANVEGMRRAWNKLSPDGKFNGYVDRKGIGNDPEFLELMYSFAKLTGEDFSPGGKPRSEGKKSDWFPNSTF